MRTVRARSAAEMPVVTPVAASIDTVNAVPCGERLSLTISGRFSCRQRSSVSVRQIEAARVHGHEVDRLGRHEVGGEDEVALVLAVLGVDEDDHPAVADARR